MDSLDWLAGLLEGEGCFSINKSYGGYVFPCIQLGMTDEDVVIRAGKLLGGNGKVREYRSRYPGAKLVYKYRVAGKRAAELMKVLLPRMGDRRQVRIQEVLKTCGYKLD